MDRFAIISSTSFLTLPISYVRSCFPFLTAASILAHAVFCFCWIISLELIPRTGISGVVGIDNENRVEQGPKTIPGMT